MKLIKYTLTSEGRTPEWVDGSIISGGQFPRANGLDSPQDWTMIGVGTDGTPADIETIDSYNELLAYMNEYLEDSNDEMFPFSVEESAQVIWSKFEQSQAN